jgi:hypothetical protein
VPSFEICPCCGIQFGYQDLPHDDLTLEELHRKWRYNWIAHGMIFHHEWLKPKDWNPVKQLSGIGINV